MKLSVIVRKIGQGLSSDQPPRKLFSVYAHTLLFLCVNFLTIFLGWFATPIVGLITGKIYFSHVFFSKIWARSSLASAGVRLKAEGLENIPQGTSVIYMSNHQSNLDWLVLWSVLPTPFRFVCKKELFKLPFFGDNLRYGGHFSLDRRAKGAAYDTIAKVMEVAKTSSIMIFPEGTRSWDGKMGEFKEGGIFVALQLGIPIVPIAIAGSFNVMSRKSWIVTPGRVNIKIGKPIVFERSEEPDLESCKLDMNKVKEAIAAMLSEIECQASR